MGWNTELGGGIIIGNNGIGLGIYQVLGFEFFRTGGWAPIPGVCKKPGSHPHRTHYWALHYSFRICQMVLRLALLATLLWNSPALGFVLISGPTEAVLTLAPTTLKFISLFAR